VRLAPVALVAASAVAAVAPARADEREFTLSLAPLASTLHVGDATAWGGGGALDLTYGVSDALSLRATGAFTAGVLGATMKDPGGTLMEWYAGGGLVYTIDILRLVPSIELGLGVIGTSRMVKGARVTTDDFGFEAGLAVDYLVNRRFSVGAVVRYHATLVAQTQIPLYLYFGPRVSVIFGG
jgi:hypothetical protein